MPQDPLEAANWLSQAANNAQPAAQAVLGRWYGEGDIVAQDYVRAHMWSNLGAANLPLGGERAAAIAYRDLLTERMTLDQIEEAQTLARNWRAEER